LNSNKSFIFCTFAAKKTKHVSTTPEINKTDLFQSHDYYAIDELLSEDHLLAREAVRAWVKQEVSPIIEDYANRAECPTHFSKVWVK
jgi:glutaryl-CoA dehydrogenase